jgi:hypothetical protein
MLQLSSGRGPVLEALSGGGPVSCPDTLTETRWPEYASVALRRGVRCCVTLAYRPGPDAVTLSLSGARPRSLESGQLAELLTAFGGAVMGNAAEYGDAKRTTLQLRAAAESRALVDQAKGHADAGAGVQRRGRAGPAAADLPGAEPAGHRCRQDDHRLAPRPGRTGAGRGWFSPAVTRRLNHPGRAARAGHGA